MGLFSLIAFFCLSTTLHAQENVVFECEDGDYHIAFQAPSHSEDKDQTLSYEVCEFHSCKVSTQSPRASFVSAKGNFDYTYKEVSNANQTLHIAEDANANPTLVERYLDKTRMQSFSDCHSSH